MARIAPTQCGIGCLSSPAFCFHFLRESMLSRAINALLRFFGVGSRGGEGGHRYPQRYSLQFFDDRAKAVAAAKAPGVAALVRGGSGYKWIIFACPCGCGQQIALSIMRSHLPRWTIEVRTNGRFTLNPSVDSTTCGAHFWVREGTVIWCQDSRPSP